ncbi:unnamed protein product [Penicillium salamii]|uniref:Zn(2)-C6 fungal-type domain-containing protein n=1 Tax=Penicillium salamii TaxID=1612424 RepID=A0A9W4JQ01_9EURO|nr:unnamed protein product [Penicillium salamii]CAG8412965.1 unnamed protein product [Penicillium salamii]
MPPKGTTDKRVARRNRRVARACGRCRDQKIRCTGSYPCDQCSKRNYDCHFDSMSERILVTRRRVKHIVK